VCGVATKGVVSSSSFSSLFSTGTLDPTTGWWLEECARVANHRRRRAAKNTTTTVTKKETTESTHHASNNRVNSIAKWRYVGITPPHAPPSWSCDIFFFFFSCLLKGGKIYPKGLTCAMINAQASRAIPTPRLWKKTCAVEPVEERCLRVWGVYVCDEYDILQAKKGEENKPTFLHPLRHLLSRVLPSAIQQEAEGPPFRLAERGRGRFR